MIIRLIVWALNRKDLSEQDRLTLLTEVMHSLKAVPLRAIITVDEDNRIFIQGKPASVEQLMSLQESAASALNSTARNLIREQVRFAAVDKGFLKSDNLKTQLFYKAALWYAQEEDELLRQMAATTDPTR